MAAAFCALSGIRRGDSALLFLSLCRLRIAEPAATPKHLPRQSRAHEKFVRAEILADAKFQPTRVNVPSTSDAFA
jgi:hypothetical protein